MTSFLLTWKESGWPHENTVRMVGQQEEQRLKVVDQLFSRCDRGAA
jgi:hypothetical protein